MILNPSYFPLLTAPVSW